MIIRSAVEYDISIQNQNVYIKAKKEYENIAGLHRELENHPRIIKIDFMKFRNAFLLLDDENICIGEARELLELRIDQDLMAAYMKLFVTEEEFETKRKEINQQIRQCLEENGITYGVKSSIFNESYDTGGEIIVAEGKLPIDGEDAIVQYIEIPDAKPEISNDGSTDFYAVELYKSVRMGDWLGSMTLATEGVDGINIIGEVLHARAGKSGRLRYDSKKVQLIEEEHEHVLSAKEDGIVEFKNGKITISSHLIIDDVNYTTGNIDFKGYVTIKGTIEDGFSVKADYDVTVNGNMGLGCVKLIESRYGSVVIKGGIYGKRKSMIKAGKDVFIKHVNQANIDCRGYVNIGYYIFDSRIKADSLEVASVRGRIIGGQILAKAWIKAQFIGNNKEIKTQIRVDGFDRKKVNDELSELLGLYKEKLKLLEYNKKALNLIEAGGEKTIPLDYKKLKRLIGKLLIDISELEERRTILNNHLKAKGQGSIEILGQMYPGSQVAIRRIEIPVREPVRGTYYYDENQIKIQKR